MIEWTKATDAGNRYDARVGPFALMAERNPDLITWSWRVQFGPVVYADGASMSAYYAKCAARRTVLTMIERMQRVLTRKTRSRK